MKKRSPLWYELPLLFLIIGGIIAYFKIKKDDPKKAKKCLILGVMLTIVPLFFFFVLQITFGVQNPIYVVSSGSMVPELEVFDVLIVDRRSYPFESIAVGDVIAFYRPSGQDRIIIHRVVAIIDEDPYTIRTKGDANPASIEGTDFPITENEYIGKVAYVIPQAGYITRIMTPPISYISSIIILSIPVIQHFRFKNKKDED